MSELHLQLEALRRDEALLLAEVQAAGADVRGPKRICCWHAGAKAYDEYIRRDPATGIVRYVCFSCNEGKGWDLFDMRAHRTGTPRNEILRQELRQMNPTTTTPQNTAPPMDWLGIAKAAHNRIAPAQLTVLADELGLSPDGLRRLRVGWITAEELRRVARASHWRSGAYTFPMRDGTGNVIGIRLRFEDHSKGAITGSCNGLFIAHALSGVGPLLICEGPTDAAAMLDMGIDAIGLPSNAAGHEYAIDYCRRHPREVVIVHQNDTIGPAAKLTPQKAQELAKALTVIVPSVRIIKPPADCKDCRDWKRQGATADEIEVAIAEADTISPAALLGRRFDAIRSGEFRAIPFPWPMVTRALQPNVPGSTTILGGDPGSTKSFLVLQCLAYWLDMGIAADVLMLEKDRNYWLQRALAQRAGVASLTDLDWIRVNAEQAEHHRRANADWLNEMGRHIFDSGDWGTRLADVTRWIRDRAEQGARILVIDPITIADAGRDRWTEDALLMREVGRIATEFGCAVIFTTHGPKGTKDRITLDNLAGGAAYSRAADSVLWITRLDEAKSVTLKATTPGGGDSDVRSIFPFQRNEEINREIVVLKARNGRGAGWKLGYWFDPGTLTFAERGVIVKPSKVTAGRDEGNMTA